MGTQRAGAGKVRFDKVDTLWTLPGGPRRVVAAYSLLFRALRRLEKAGSRASTEGRSLPSDEITRQGSIAPGEG